FSTDTLMWLIPALPLAAAIVIGAFGPRVLRGRSHWPCILAIGASFVCSVLLLTNIALLDSESFGGPPKDSVGIEKTYTLWTWAIVKDAYTPATPPPLAPKLADFAIDITLRADPLTCI